MEGQSDVDQHRQQGYAGFSSVLHGGQVEGHHEVALLKEVGIQQVGVSFAFARGIEQQVVDLVLVFQGQTGFGHGHPVGRAFYLDAFLGGEVEGVLAKVTLIAVVLQQHQPKQAGGAAAKHVVDVDLGLIGGQLVIVAAHAAEGEGHGIGHAGLFHLFFHVLQNVFDRHAVKHPHEGLVHHHFKGHLVAGRGCLTLAIGFVLPGQEGKLRAVELEFHLGVGRHVLIDLGEVAGQGADVELVLSRVIHQGFLALDAGLIVFGGLAGIPSPLLHLTSHISVSALTFQFAKFVPQVGLQQGAKVLSIGQVHARGRLGLGVVAFAAHLADATVAEIIDGPHDELAGIGVISGGLDGDHLEFHLQNAVPFRAGKGKRPIVDANCNGVDEFVKGLMS